MKTIILFLFAALTLQAETSYEIVEIRKELEKGAVVRSFIVAKVTIDGTSNTETHYIPKENLPDLGDAVKLKVLLSKALAKTELSLEASLDQAKTEKIDPSIISITAEDVATEKSKLNPK